MNSVQLQPDSAADGPVSLPVAATTVTAGDLRAQLLSALDGPAGVEIDAGAVENVGQAVLQLLVAARAEAERRGSAYRIVAASDAFATRVRECRLADIVGLADQKDENDE